MGLLGIKNNLLVLNEVWIVGIKMFMISTFHLYSRKAHMPSLWPVRENLQSLSSLTLSNSNRKNKVSIGLLLWVAFLTRQTHFILLQCQCRRPRPGKSKFSLMCFQRPD